MNEPSIGRYEIRDELGRGGMATVYRAHDPRFNRDVAIKTLSPELLHDPTFQARFEIEARTIAALEHSGIVPVYDFGDENGQPYLVMRLMTGGSLSARLRKGPLPLAETARILGRLAPALDYAHQKGVIHRDLKPANILFDQHGDPYLSDFGIAKLAESTATLTGKGILGTPAYMSPEQGRGEPGLDGATDIYALGAILFEMLTGRVPYESTTPTGQLIRHITDPIPDIQRARPGLPPATQTVIARSMAKRKYARYPQAAELARDVAALANGRDVQIAQPDRTAILPQRPAAPSRQPPPQRKAQPVPAKPKRNPPGWLQKLPPWVIWLVVCLIALGGMTWLFSSGPQPGGGPQRETSTAAIPTPLPRGFARVESLQGSPARYILNGQEQPASRGVDIAAGEQTRLQTNNGSLLLSLSDDSRLYIDQDTTLWLLELPQDGQTETTLKLEEGRLLLVNGQMNISTLREFTASGQQALMGISFTPTDGSFQVDCFSGKCTVGSQALRPGERGGFYQGAAVAASAQNEPWLALQAAFGASEISAPTPHTEVMSSPTPTSTPEPTATPTPTRAVRVFQPTFTPTKKPGGGGGGGGSDPTKTPDVGSSADPTNTPDVGSG